MERLAKSEVRTRLEALTEADVLPTRRSEGERRVVLSDVAAGVEAGDVDLAADLSFHDASSELGGDHLTAPGLPALMDLRDSTEQLAGLARAGFNFFVGTTEFKGRNLDDRRAVGGNGSVTRVLTGPETILLETQRINVGFAEGVNDLKIEEVTARFGLAAIRPLRFATGLSQFVVASSTALEDCLEIMEDDAVDYAEPDFIQYIGQRMAPLPTDPLLGQQWHHAAIDTAAAWPGYTGAGVTVAIVDNGFASNHPDLTFDPVGSAWFRSTPDGDDADLVAGLAGMPVDNHGTACAGMAAADANAVGGVGVAPDATLRGVACLQDQVGTQSTLARALAYAATPSLETGAAIAGAHVIACSLGPNGAVWRIENVLRDAIDYVVTLARDGLGVPLFWAVTNGNFPIAPDEVSSHPDIISVGRSTVNDRDDGSGYGPKLDFLAPGVDVLIPDSAGAYSATTGTSFACPCAAGVAALMLEKRGTLSASDVRAHLQTTCAKVGNLPYDAAGRNDRFGHGRIDAARAVASVP